MNPCIIIHNAALERYEAYNEDGRRICCESAPTGMIVALTGHLAFLGYDSVPLNSRLGRTIFDKLPLSVQMATRRG